MTRDDIIRMAREAELLLDIETTFPYAEGTDIGPMLEKFAALVAAAEREACAKACERLEKHFAILGEEFEYAPRIPTAEDFAAYIRSRGEI